MSDNVEIRLGDGNDLKLNHDGTDSFIRQTGSGDLYIKQEVDDKDIKFQCDNGSGGLMTYLTIDGGAGLVNLPDNIPLSFGTSNDFKISHGSGATNIINETGHITIQQRLDDGDIVFQCDDGSGGLTDYFRLDGSTTSMQASKNIVFADNIRATFGGGADMAIYHNSVSQNGIIENFTNDLIIQNNADDEDIVFKCDNGSGGVTEYFRVDGSSQYNIFSKDLYIIDDVILRLGTGNDLRIFHEAGGTSKIENYTGNLTIQQRADDSDIVFQCDDGSGGLTEYFRVDGGAEAIIVSKNVQHADNVKAYFGNAIDLEIYHDGSDSYIKDSGTGDLKIQGDNNVYIGSTGGEFYFRGIKDDAAVLYFNNSSKLTKFFRWYYIRITKWNKI